MQSPIRTSNWQRAAVGRRPIQCAAILTVLTLLGTTSSQEPGSDARFEALHRTPNWRFITPEFIERIDSRQSELRGPPISLVGTLKDVQGEAVPNAFVLLRIKSNNTAAWDPKRDSRTAAPVEDVFAVTWSDRQGVFKFQDQPTPWYEPTYELDWQLTVFAAGKSIQFLDYHFFDAQARIEHLVLQPEAVVEGVALDSTGQPLNQIAFAQYEVINPYDSTIEQSFLFSECLCPVIPDANGRFRLGGLPPDRIVTVFSPWVTQQKIPQAKVATTQLDEERLYPQKRPRSVMLYPFTTGAFELRAKLAKDELPESPPDPRNAFPASRKLDRQDGQRLMRSITVRVRDAETGLAIPRVGLASALQKPTPDNVKTLAGMPATDQDGTAMIEAQAGRELFVFALGRTYGYLTPYGRMTTALDEYTPPVDYDGWFASIPQGNEDAVITLELRPISPLKLIVRQADGSPAADAQVIVRRSGVDYVAFRAYTDNSGEIRLPLRPVLFEVDIEVTTAQGLTGGLTNFMLSQDFERDEQVTITVR